MSSASGHNLATEPFPHYTQAEFAADRAVHILGLLAAACGSAWLLATLPGDAGPVRVVTTWVYAAGLLGMLSASAAYNMVRPSRAKAVLRRIDRCMIFVMIAGTYTPFALEGLPRPVGVPLCITVWSLAALGIALEHAAPRLARPLSLPLYLGMGWLVLGILPALMAAIGTAPLVLLVAGGVVYSLGAALQAHGKLLFHNAVWHVMVAVGAGLHFVAIVLLRAPAG